MAESNASHLARTVDAGDRARLESLTGLRWWAAFGIFFAHINVFLPIPGAKGLFGLGVGGVTFFFILSGFVLAWTANEGDTASWFYARRFARVWPLLFIAVALPLMFTLTSGQDIDATHMILASVGSLLLIQAWVPGWILVTPNPVTWSLSCEAFFYAVFPLFIRPIARRTLRQLGTIAAALILVGWAIRIALWIAYPPARDVSADDVTSSGLLVLGTYAPLARLNEFLLGVVIAVAMKRGWRSPVSVRAAAALVLVGFAVLWLFRDAVWRSQIPYDALNQVCAPLFALLIAAVATRDARGGRSLLRARPIVRLGQWSYAFYLFHFIVVLSVAGAVFPGKQVVDFFVDPVEPSWSHAGWAAVAMAISILFAGLVYRFYEYPLEGRLRRFFRRRLAITTGPSAALAGVPARRISRQPSANTTAAARDGGRMPAE